MSNLRAQFTVAIDGPSGVGKSSTAETLAMRLNFSRIDSGCLYRAVTYVLINKLAVEVITNEMIVENKDFINNLLLEVIKDEIRYEGENIKPMFRSQVIDKNVSRVAKHLFIREKVLLFQRNLIKDMDNGVIIDGRDIGTVVMPNADLKVFLTASEEVRAKRRFVEIKDESVTYEHVLIEMKRRDYEDINREHASLRKADDAIEVDNSELTFDQQVQKIYDMIVRKMEDKSEKTQ